MSGEAKTQIRIEGWPESDTLIRDLLAFAERLGMKPTTAARAMIRRGLDSEKAEQAILKGTR